MAEVAILAALKSLGDALASELVRRAFSQSCIIGSSNLEASMNNINGELRVMKEFIDHTDIHDQSNADQVIWVNEVRMLANRIEDAVAELVYLIGNKRIGRKLLSDKAFQRSQDIASCIAITRSREKH
jgi:putative NADH-flavin reductase